ncbi:MAG: flagellin lysine-N-methylase [Clostridia bacterium]|nr:flagellin lysine-N-methylase [Clostridia bacterium]
MKILYPDYCQRFSCLGGSCPDSCCKAWEICIDPDTVSFYHGVKGELGERLRSALAVDEDGDAYFPLVKGCCPFLDPDGLCEIHRSLGEAATSGVCRQFPYFIEEYEGFTEKCPSLSCPAAAELVLTEPLTEDVYPVPPGSPDPLLDLLARGRTAALAAAARYDFPESAARIRAMARDLQEIADDFDPGNVAYDFDAVLTDAAYADGAEEFARWLTELTERCLNFLRTDAEILTEEWRGLLETALTQPEPVAVLPTEQKAVERALRYFLYRCFLKPVNDGEVVLWTLFILLSVAVCVAVADRTGTDFRRIARLYSKEIEHDTENVEALLVFLSVEF